MTVAELIAELQKQVPHHTVLIEVFDGYVSVASVGEVGADMSCTVILDGTQGVL